MGAYIDFKALRGQLKFEDVLRHYKVEIRTKAAGQHFGFCPLPSHQGKRNSRSFSANLTRGIFQCFGCGAKGNLLDFAVLMDGRDPENGEHLRESALALQKAFGLAAAKPEKQRQSEQPELPVPAQKPGSHIVVNAPLDFELKRLDPDHPYLDKRGFSRDTVRHFGLGYCSKGLLAGRIAVPLHSRGGQLLGYAGRLVDDTLIDDEHPKYKFPPKRERNGILYEFHKMLVLYNSNRLTRPVSDLAIVEGFPSVWWITQMGFPHVVAVMGAAMSKEQADIVADLVPPTGRVFVIPDGNEAGRRCAVSVFEHIAPIRFLHWLKLDEGKQPTDYPGGWFRQRLG